jgi:threonine dehydratase
VRVVKTAGLVGLDEITDARRLLRGVAVQTPLDRSRALSDHVGGPVFIKCENLQRTGSFKIRGAYNRIARLSDQEREAGVVAASAGNHAQGVALAASLSDVASTVFMPDAASLPKVEATRRYGAEVILTGKDFGAAYDAAMERVRSTGATFVPPFDHPHVIAGQGTIGCEIVEQMPDVSSIVVPIGGGGLISGVAAAARALRPDVRIVGVQAAGAAAFPPSLERGTPVTLDRMSTIADGIAANCPGELTLAHVEELRPPVVVVLSGGNIDPLLLLRVIRFGLSASGRYFAFHTRIPDKPGELSKLLALVAKVGVNVLGVEHHREGVAVHLGEVDVALQVETRGPAHIDEMTEQLSEEGYSLERL